MRPSIHLAAIHLANAVDALTHYKTGSFGLSFTPEFFGDIYDAHASSHPESVADAIVSMKVNDPEQWNDLAENVFGIPGDKLTEESVFEKILETDSCGDLRAPVDVWIDKEGWYTVDVYDAKEINKGTEDANEHPF